MNNRKITLLVNSLGRGGLEKVGANLSIGFSNAGFIVQIISFQDNISFKYKGELINLGVLKRNKSNIANLISRFQKLYNSVVKFSPDYIIDLRNRTKTIQEIVISYYLFRKYDTILTVHGSRLDHYFLKNKKLNNYIYSKIHKTVCVSKGIEKLVINKYNIDNTTTIYNPFILEQTIKDTYYHPRKFIIAIGRMDDNVKGFEYLINAYANSKIKTEVDLLILGDGILIEKYKYLASSLDIGERVFFKGYKRNITSFIQQAEFFVMSSISEGFPMSILESLSIGTPVVSFDSPTGPSEIIEHEKNGLLVKYLSTNELTKAMDRIYFDNDLYKLCKNNTLKSVEKFNLENIIKKWKRIL